jgi:hypothetical protein
VSGQEEAGCPGTGVSWTREAADRFTSALSEACGGREVLDALIAGVEQPADPVLLGVAEAGDVLPVPTTGWDWNRVKRHLGWEAPTVARVKRAALEEVAREVRVLRGDKQVGAALEDGWKRVFPPRTKTDLRIRRCRIMDVYSWYVSRGREQVFWGRAQELSSEGDYIWAMNMLLAAELLGEEWWQRMDELGAHNGGLSGYIRVCKALNDLLKTQAVTFADWKNYVELATLVGYRNPPFPGFDVVEESRLLAQGEQAARAYTIQEFRCVAEQVLSATPDPIVWVGFTEFVESGDWLTTGSSSEGRVEVEYEVKGKLKVKRIRARKNMVPDCVELSWLAGKAYINWQQINKTLVKSELGKIRIAVAGDLLTYLQQTWINRMLNGSYKAWAGSTIEEDVEQQSRRMVRMLKLASERFGLPFDYAGFDHQPTTEEIVAIVRILMRCARINVPQDHRAEYDLICLRVVWGFRNSVLKVRRENGTTTVFKVLGGVMSGLRWTTVLGNAWNSVVTSLVATVLGRLGADMSGVERYIRGDDSAIYTVSWQQAALFERGYAGLGIKGGVGKFSIRWHAMEFLRVWYDRVCSGYPARALPGLSQRKPWSNQPWSDDLVLAAQVDVAKTLVRRGVELADSFIHWVTRRWCRLKRLPVAVLTVPRNLGGFGLYPWGGDVLLSRHLPRPGTGGVRVLNQTGWRAKKWGERAAELGIVVTETDLKVLAHDDLVKTIAADDVPGVSRVLRDQWNDSLRREPIKAVVRTRCDSTLLGDLAKLFTTRSPPEDVYRDWKLRLQQAAPEYGRFSGEKQKFEDAKVLLAKGGGSMSAWMSREMPDLKAGLARFHSSWDRSERLDYLFGNISVVTRLLHPALAGLLALGVAGIMRPARKVTKENTALLTGWIENEMLATEFVQRTYMW